MAARSTGRGAGMAGARRSVAMSFAAIGMAAPRDLDPPPTPRPQRRRRQQCERELIMGKL
jgi:hypothetical protein